MPVEKRIGDKIKAGAQTRGVEVSDEEVFQATRDSLRALMMIRAYRMRGHLHANLDPLGLAGLRDDHHELDPATYGFSRGDYDRTIFIDHVLGLEFATIREMLDILRRTYCSTLGVEFMHISDPEEKSWMQERIEGPDKGIAFTQRGQARDPEQADRGRRLREVHRRQIHRHQALRPRRRANPSSRRWSRSSSAAARSACATSCSAWRIAGG